MWAGQLGDGRALSLGEIIDPAGKRWELQLKVGTDADLLAVSLCRSLVLPTGQLGEQQSLSSGSIPMPTERDTSAASILCCSSLCPAIFRHLCCRVRGRLPSPARPMAGLC